MFGAMGLAVMRLPIAVKYSTLVLTTILATSGLLSWFSLNLIGSEMKTQLVKRGEAMALHLSYMAAPMLLSKDEAKIAAALNNVLKDPDILSGTIVDAEHLVVADSRPEQIGKPFSDPDLPTSKISSAFQYQTDNAERLTFFQAALYGPDRVRVGGVVIHLSRGALDKILSSATSRLLFITAIIALAVILLSFITLRRTLKPLTRVVEATQQLSAGHFSTRIEVCSKDEIGVLADAFNNMAAHTELLFRYVDKDIAERMTNDESLARPGGQLKTVSVLFGDMRGFTSLSNQRSPSEVVAILNAYFDLFFQVVNRFKGVVDKTMGDAIMAFFESTGGKIPTHTRNATMAAVAMRASVWALKKITTEALWQNIPLDFEPREFGFAVATGRLILGNIGSDRHLDYTVCGPPVNLASRLQDETSRGEIVVDRFTALDVEDLVLCRQLPQVQPKGFSELQKVTPFQVVVLRPTEWDHLHQLLKELFNRRFFQTHLHALLEESTAHRSAGHQEAFYKNMASIVQRVLEPDDLPFLVE
jgi:class 3 adenylate cyclase